VSQPDLPTAEEMAVHLRAAFDLLQSAGGTALGLAISGSNHPDPDAALMGIQEAVQEISPGLVQVLQPFNTQPSKYAFPKARGA
jgi:hypothetical protein